MQAKQNRINTKLFPELRKNKSYQGEFFVVRVSFLDSIISQPKSVCIVSKKIEKSAVKRNKIKRRVYSIIKLAMNESNKKNALQIFPNKQALTVKYKNLETDLINIITNNKLL